MNSLKSQSHKLVKWRSSSSGEVLLLVHVYLLGGQFSKLLTNSGLVFKISSIFLEQTLQKFVQ